MSDRRRVEERIRKKEHEIQSLENQIREGRAYIQALQDVLKILPRDSIGGANGNSTLRPGSAVAQVREIILKEGVPVHISVLLERLGRELNRDTRASLGGSLAAYVRRGEIFTRPRPNTFGLIELGHEGQTPASEPPANFGEQEIDF